MNDGCPICHRPLGGGRNKTCGDPKCRDAHRRQRRGLPIVGKTDFCDGCGGPGPFKVERISGGTACHWCLSCQRLEAKAQAT